MNFRKFHSILWRKLFIRNSKRRRLYLAWCKFMRSRRSLLARNRKGSLIDIVKGCGRKSNVFECAVVNYLLLRGYQNKRIGIQRSYKLIRFYR